MLSKETIIKVTNRDNGITGYDVKDLGISRTYQPEETKEVSFDEIYKLSNQMGGMALIRNCLIIQNEEAVDQILNGVEPEYFYSEKEILKLLKEGTMDEFLDCLDFAPKGVIEVLKNKAVELELNDMNKREAIQEKTGFNVTSAINLKKSVEKEKPVAKTTRRRATPINRRATSSAQSENTARRATPAHKE